MASRERAKESQDLQQTPRPQSTSPFPQSTVSRPPSSKSSTDKMVPGGKPIPTGNIVGYLSLFFAQGSFVDKEMLPFISKEDEKRVLTVMLRDIVRRKCSLEDLTLHLFAYCTRVDTYSLDTHQLFLKAMWKMLPLIESHLVTPICRRVLAKLAYAIPFAMEDLLMEMCDEKQAASRSGTGPGGCLFGILEESLRYAQEKERTELKENEPRFIDDTFRMGDSPLVFTALRRRYDLTLLFLRYGAHVDVRWLSFDGLLEVLLFSPNSLVISDMAKSDIEECIPLLCAALPDNSCYSKLMKKKEAGYCELYPGWEDAVGDNIAPRGVRCLQHLSRCAIRSHLNQFHSLPASIYSLPVPHLIKKYLDLLLV